MIICACCFCPCSDKWKQAFYQVSDFMFSIPMVTYPVLYDTSLDKLDVKEREFVQNYIWGVAVLIMGL